MEELAAAAPNALVSLYALSESMFRALDQI